MKELSPEALLQLAQYQPCRDAGSTKDATFEQMVPAVLMESGGSLAGPRELRKSFDELFGVEIELDEISGWLDDLKRSGTIEWSKERLAITAETRASLEKRKRTFEALTETAYQEWSNSLLRLDPSLTDEQIEDLQGDLDSLIGVMVAYHGAEAAVILYPEEPRSAVLRDTLHQQVQVLPDRGPKSNELRRQALFQFFSAPTEAQRHYLADRLDHGFFATVGTLRPSAAPAMRKELSGLRLYLDTNVLIPVLGLSGRQGRLPARRLLELTRGLGVQLAVTTRTLEEYQHSLKNEKKRLPKQLPDRRFARLLKEEANRAGGPSLTKGFFESYEMTGATPDDWFRKASKIRQRLEELEIEVVDDHLDLIVKREATRIEEYSKLLSQQAVRQRKERDPHPIKHDVIHRILIERLRGDSPHDFLSAGHWFLTEDKLLPDFGHMSIAGEDPPEIPFCMSGSAWAQIARCFTPRTDDYDQMVTDLLASPYISFGRSRSLAEVQQVVNRIASLLDDASPAVVAAVVGDEVLEAVAGAPRQSEKDEVLLEAYKRADDERAEEISALGTQLEQVQIELKKKEAEAGDASRLRQRIDALEQKLKEQTAGHARDKALSAAEISHLKKEKKERILAEEMRRRKVKRAVVTATSLAAIVLLAALAYAAQISASLMLFGIGLILALVLAPVADNPKWAGRVGFVLAVLGALLGLVQQV